jgi:hypothetical protein
MKRFGRLGFKNGNCDRKRLPEDQKNWLKLLSPLAVGAVFYLPVVK